MRYIRVEYGLASIALVVAAACGGGAPATSVATTAPNPTTGGAATVAPGGGVPDADALCAAFDETMATTALDEPVNSAQSGDVLPRPNGVYCHYSAVADGNHNVEAQLKDMTREEFDALAETLQVDEELSGVGEAAYKLERSLLSPTGAFVMVFDGGQGVTVNINDDGDQAVMNQAAIDIALAALAS